jgi:hypothetical protein
MRETASGIALMCITVIECLWWPHQTASDGITPPQFVLFRVEGTQQSTIDVLSDEEGSGVHSAGRTDEMIK